MIECDPRLVALYQRSFPGASIFGSPRCDTSWLANAPKIDVCVRIAGLMRYLRPDLESFSPSAGMLKPKPELRDSFKRFLNELRPGPNSAGGLSAQWWS